MHPFAAKVQLMLIKPASACVLLWSAVINGVLAVQVLVAMMLVAIKPAVMGGLGAILAARCARMAHPCGNGGDRGSGSISPRAQAA